MMRWQSRLVLVACLGLCGCISPQKLQKTREDAAAYSAAQQERSVEQRCIDSGAMPGTQANLDCRLGLNKPSQNPPPH